MMHVSFLGNATFAVVAVLAAESAFAAVNARSYVPGGLAAQYDGIDNAGFGSHSGDAATWADGFWFMADPHFPRNAGHAGVFDALQKKRK